MSEAEVIVTQNAADLPEFAQTWLNRDSPIPRDVDYFPRQASYPAMATAAFILFLTIPFGIAMLIGVTNFIANPEPAQWVQFISFVAILLVSGLLAVGLIRSAWKMLTFNLKLMRMTHPLRYGIFLGNTHLLVRVDHDQEIDFIPYNAIVSIRPLGRFEPRRKNYGRADAIELMVETPQNGRQRPLTYLANAAVRSDQHIIGRVQDKMK